MITMSRPRPLRAGLHAVTIGACLLLAACDSNSLPGNGNPDAPVQGGVDAGVGGGGGTPAGGTGGFHDDGGAGGFAKGGSGGFHNDGGAGGFGDGGAGGDLAKGGSGGMSYAGGAGGFNFGGEAGTPAAGGSPMVGGAGGAGGSGPFPLPACTQAANVTFTVGAQTMPYTHACSNLDLTPAATLVYHANESVPQLLIDACGADYPQTGVHLSGRAQKLPGALDQPVANYRVEHARQIRPITIVVTEFGVQGGIMRGTFEGTAEAALNEDAAPVKGTFTVCRGRDREEP
jgi:hypothetical protein